MKKEKDIKIKRTNLIVECTGKHIRLLADRNKKDFLWLYRNVPEDYKLISLPEAKELSKVLPKFLEEMER